MAHEMCAPPPGRPWGLIPVHTNPTFVFARSNMYSIVQKDQMGLDKAVEEVKYRMSTRSRERPGALCRIRRPLTVWFAAHRPLFGNPEHDDHPAAGTFTRVSNSLRPSQSRALTRVPRLCPSCRSTCRSRRSRSSRTRWPARRARRPSRGACRASKPNLSAGWACSTRRRCAGSARPL